MIEKDDIKTTAEITDAYDMGKFVPVENIISTHKVADELEEILIITSARDCSHKEMYNYLVMQIKRLRQTLRGGK